MTVSPIPLSELGTLTGRFYLDDSWPIVAMRCYLDGSEVSGEEDQWMTLACIVASDPIWAEFQKRWEHMLQDRYPIAPFLHMVDLISNSDPFERVVGWDYDKQTRFVYDASEVLRTFTGPLCATYCSINLSARTRILSEGIEVEEPELICTEISLHEAIKWHTKRYGSENIYLFFDQGEKYIKTIKGRWREHEKKIIKSPNVWGRIANIQEVNMRVTPPVQAADLLAWSISRMHRKTPDVWSTLAEKLVWTIDQETGATRSGMLNTAGIICNEGVLRRRAIRNASS